MFLLQLYTEDDIKESYKKKKKMKINKDYYNYFLMIIIIINNNNNNNLKKSNMNKRTMTLSWGKGCVAGGLCRGDMLRDMAPCGLSISSSI